MNIPKIHHIPEPCNAYTVGLSDKTYHQNISSVFLLNTFWKCYNRYIRFDIFINILITVPLNGHGFKETTLKPKNKQDYTKLAIDTYEKAKWDCYGFKGNSTNPTKTIDNYLHIGWGILFQRKLPDREVQLLKHWIHRRKKAEEYCANDKDTHSHRIRTQSEYIGSDGFITMRKIVPTPPDNHPIETKRLEDLLNKLKIIKGMWK